ncbi:hypothetical protein, partial [Undibacterium luofuense]|uniref:hypothetical protein n=1 Tax=Undibacterium luofuense TaxID=2828733 RepID=UPI0030EED947
WCADENLCLFSSFLIKNLRPHCQLNTNSNPVTPDKHKRSCDEKLKTPADTANFVHGAPCSSSSPVSDRNRKSEIFFRVFVFLTFSHDKRFMFRHAAARCRF